MRRIRHNASSLLLRGLSRSRASRRFDRLSTRCKDALDQAVSRSCLRSVRLCRSAVATRNQLRRRTTSKSWTTPWVNTAHVMHSSTRRDASGSSGKSATTSRTSTPGAGSSSATPSSPVPTRTPRRRCEGHGVVHRQCERPHREARPGDGQADHVPDARRIGARSAHDDLRQEGRRMVHGAGRRSHRSSYAEGWQDPTVEDGSGLTPLRNLARFARPSMVRPVRDEQDRHDRSGQRRPSRPIHCPMTAPVRAASPSRPMT